MKIEFVNFGTKKIRVQLNKKEYSGLIDGIIRYKGLYTTNVTARNLNMFFVSRVGFKNFDIVIDYLFALETKIRADKRLDQSQSKLFKEMEG